MERIKQTTEFLLQQFKNMLVNISTSFIRLGVDATAFGANAAFTVIGELLGNLKDQFLNILTSSASIVENAITFFRIAVEFFDLLEAFTKPFITFPSLVVTFPVAVWTRVAMLASSIMELLRGKFYAQAQSDESVWPAIPIRTYESRLDFLNYFDTYFNSLPTHLLIRREELRTAWLSLAIEDDYILLDNQQLLIKLHQKYMANFQWPLGRTNEITDAMQMMMYCQEYIPLVEPLGLDPSRFFNAWCSASGMLLNLECPFLEKVKDIYYDRADNAVPQSGELSFITPILLSLFLPDPLKTIFREASIFTSQKVLDSSSAIFDFIGFFLRLPATIAKLFPENPISIFIIGLVDYLEVYFPLGSFGKRKYQLNALVEKHSKTPTLVGDEVFQDEFITTYTEFKEFLDNLWDNDKIYPKFLQSLYTKSTHLHNKIMYMRRNLRVEPLWMVFYGPAGTGKTALMNSLVSSYQKQGTSVYVHSTPSDSKDFHDMYDNEDVYVCDDVGQKGIFQWSSYINMISTTKYPLDCAAVEKKGTKFFTSRLAMCTTNLIDLDRKSVV